MPPAHQHFHEIGNLHLFITSSLCHVTMGWSQVTKISRPPHSDVCRWALIPRIVSTVVPGAVIQLWVGEVGFVLESASRDEVA